MITIYVLQCQQNKYYVGKSNNIDFRLEEHFNNEGSEWRFKTKINNFCLEPNLKTKLILI